MKHTLPLRRGWKLLLTVALAAVVHFTPAPAGAQSNLVEIATKEDLLASRLKATNVDGAWNEYSRAAELPQPPAEWEKTAPTQEQKRAFYVPYMIAKADRAEDFSTRFPADKHAATLELEEFQLREILLQVRYTNQEARFFTVGKILEQNPDLPTQTHFAILFKLAQNSPPEQAQAIYQQIIASAPDSASKDFASGELRRLNMIDKPLDLKFTAVDGRGVDLAALKGKVVMVDFWATWCPPCVAEVPDVKKTYDEYHGKGFEIIGISLDKEKGKLEQFTAAHHMEWPQYFDGQYWDNKYAVLFGIHSVPTMWLVDKKGLLRVMDARDDLAGQVGKMLAE